MALDQAQRLVPARPTAFTGHPGVPHRNHATAAQLPTGGALGFQAGVAASPRNSAYEDYLNQIAEQEQTRPAANLGRLTRPLSTLPKR